MGAYEHFIGHAIKASGAFTSTTSIYMNNFPVSSGQADSRIKMSFKASDSSSIYNETDTVQPPANQNLIIIKF